MEFLVTIETKFPESMDETAIQEVKEAERARALELRNAGTLERIWRKPGRRGLIALYSVADATELHDTLASLPQFPWMEIEVTALARHALDAGA